MGCRCFFCLFVYYLNLDTTCTFLSTSLILTTSKSSLFFAVMWPRYLKGAALTKYFSEYVFKKCKCNAKSSVLIAGNPPPVLLFLLSFHFAPSLPSVLFFVFILFFFPGDVLLYQGSYRHI